MAKHATVRELKNRTTAIIREAEKGKAVVVTRRGKPVATLRSQLDLTVGSCMRKKPTVGKAPTVATRWPWA